MTISPKFLFHTPFHRLAIAAIGTSLAGIAISLSWAGNMANQLPQTELPFASIVPSVGMAKVNVRFALAEARNIPDRSASKNAKALLNSAPMSAEPFFYTAFDEFPTANSKGTRNAQLLLEEAIRRDPRHRGARFVLMRRYILNQDLREGLAQLIILYKLAPEQTARVLAFIGKNLKRTSEVDEVVAALGGEPDLFEQIVTGYLSEKRPVALSVYLGNKIADSSTGFDPVRRKLAASLVQLGEFEEARKLSNVQSGLDRRAFVTDPHLESNEESGPFSWEKTESNVGVAEKDRSGGVFVTFYGRRSGPLLRQLVTLPPGEYRLFASLEGTNESNGAIELFASCVGNPIELATRPIGIADGRKSVLELRFSVVSPECKGQYIGLQGSRERSRKTQSVRVLSVDISRETA